MTGLDIVIARPVLVYGPGARANLKALMKLCDGRIPLPFGAANNKRSFVSLENVARALIFLSEAPAEKVAGRVFHLAEPQPRLRHVKSWGKARAAMQRPARLVPVPPLIMKFLLGGSASAVSTTSFSAIWLRIVPCLSRPDLNICRATRSWN